MLIVAPVKSMEAYTDYKVIIKVVTCDNDPHTYLYA